MEGSLRRPVPLRALAELTMVSMIAIGTGPVLGWAGAAARAADVPQAQRGGQLSPVLRLYVADELESEFVLVDDGSGPPGVDVYVGSADAPGWAMAWDVQVDPDPSELFDIDAMIQFTNRGTTETLYEITLEIPICPTIDGGSHAGGTAEVTLATSPNGGRLRSGPSPSLWALIADGQVTNRLIWSPFLMSITGAGEASADDVFGMPIPSASGPLRASTLGVRLHFFLTGADTMTSRSRIGVNADLEDLDPCTFGADLDGDGDIDYADLVQLMGQWGECDGDCPADLNGDGVVNLVDLTILLSLLEGA